MHKQNRLVPSVALALASLLLAACTQSGGGQAVASGEMVVKTTEFKFEPSSFRVEAGKPIKLVLTNAGQIEHDLMISGLMPGGQELQVAAGAGEKASIEFAPDKPGVYEIVCTLPGHKSAGMVGKIEVVAARTADAGR